MLRTVTELTMASLCLEAGTAAAGGRFLRLPAIRGSTDRVGHRSPPCRSLVSSWGRCGSGGVEGGGARRKR